MKIRDIFKRKAAVAVTTDMKERERLVRQTLTQMNCQHRWEDEEEEKVVAFDYQNGHFRIRIEKDSPFVRLMFLFFYSTKAEHLNIVRHICNQCNLNSESERVVYSTNPEKNEVDVHGMTGVLLHPDNASEVLAHAMRNMFSWQNAFARRFEEMVKDAGKESDDIEADAIRWGHEMSLLREMELAHQPEGGLRVAADDEQPLALVQLVKRLLGLDELQVMGVSVLEGPMRTAQPTPEQDGRLTVSQLLDDARLDRCTVLLTYRDATLATRTVMLLMQKSGEDDHTAYYRLTLTLAPLSARYHDVPFAWSDNPPQSVSALIAYDRKSDKQRNDEFRYLWKEALEKGKAGDTDALTPEQRLICDVREESLAKDLFFGRRQFANNCFAQALPHLEHAYRRLRERFSTMKSTQKEHFFEVCYLIGFCYAELRQYDRALYYLDITAPLRRITYTIELVNCMVNAKDVRAEQMVDGLIGELETRYGDDDDDDGGDSPMLDDNVRRFYNFLRRRKVFLLIERENYGVARVMLKKMLEEPENNDFAINELAYLQRIAPQTAGDDAP